MYKRQTVSYYGDSIHQKFPVELPCLQSEELPSFLPFYIGEKWLDDLERNNNQLIIGRRGTGKTHLLGAFKERVIDRRKKGIKCDSIVAMVSGSDFCGTPPTFLDSTLQFARARYSRLLFKCFLENVVDTLISETFDFLDCKDVSKAERKKQIKNAESVLTRLMELLSFGSINPAVSEFEQEQCSSYETFFDRGTSLGAKVGLGLGSVNGAASLKFNRGKKKTESKKNLTSVVTRGEMSIDLRKIRDCVLELLKILGVNRFYILIDEWTQIDKTITLGIQPYFAELLKLTFFNSSKIAVKVACIWNETHLYDRELQAKSKGLQLDHDISMAVDLDTAFITKSEDIDEFFKRMLFKRMSYHIPELKELEKGGVIDDYFLTEFFDTPLNFRSLIVASHGIPRDFWTTFDKCALKIRRRFKESAITKEMVWEVAQHKYVFEKRKNIEKSSKSFRLWEKINEYMEKTSRRYFLVENQHAKESLALRKLVEDELCHPVPSPICPREIRDKFKIFVIDCGNCVDLFISRKKVIDKVLENTLIPNFPEDLHKKIDSFTIEVQEFTDVILCRSCRRAIHTYDSFGRLYHLCPKCADPDTSKDHLQLQPIKYDKKAIKALLLCRVHEAASKHGISYNKVFVRRVSNKWGGCTKSNNLVLNIDLVGLPDKLQDYVVLHQLVHIQYKKHDKFFWTRLNELTKEAKELHSEVMQYGYMEI